MKNPNFEQLVQKHSQIISEWRNYWEPLISDDQIESVAQVIAYREMDEPIPDNLAPYEVLRASLRRRSFC